MAVTTVGGATVYASEEHGPSSEAAPAWENYDARIAEIRTETDLVKREALMHEAEDELMNTWAIIPLYYYNDVYMQKTDVENIYSNLFGFKYFGFATVPALQSWHFQVCTATTQTENWFLSLQTAMR